MRAPVLVLVVAVGCAEAPLTIDEQPCPPDGTQLTYGSFGARFLDAHCNTCHTMSRHGAPAAFRFDTPDLVRRHARRIFVRSAGPNTTMPPGPDDPPADERDQLAEWLACGAP